MIDLILGGVIASILFLAGRYTWREARNGRCAGCSACPGKTPNNCKSEESSCSTCPGKKHSE